MFSLIQRWGLLALALQILTVAAVAQEDPFDEVETPREDSTAPAREVPEKEPLPAAAKPQDTAKKIAPESVEGLSQRLHAVQTEIARRKKQPAPQMPDDKDLIFVLEDPHLSQGRYHSNNEYDRSFVVRMLIANPTDKAVELKREGITLTSDQKTYKALERLSNYHDSYNIGQKSYSISSLKTPEMLAIPAGKTVSTWVVFGALPMNPAVPDLKLNLTIGKETREIDVNGFCEGLLKTRVERKGPKKCLAILTIAGQLDPVNVKNLVDELDDLAVTQKLARVIIRWDKDADPVETQLMDWLKNSANQAGQIRPANQNPNNPYPIVPLSIRELHLAEQPQDNAKYNSSEGQPRIHNTTGEAVIAALRTAYQALSANEIVDDLRNRDPIIRSAALMGGGGRLPPDKLPVLLEFVNSKDRNLQRAAIFAMRNFGEKPAIQTLIDLVKKNKTPSSTEAAESLATSRFAAASDALLDLLKTAEPNVKTSIVQILAKHPRPLWAEVMLEYAWHPETPIGMASLRALNGIGHPDLLALLKHALELEPFKGTSMQMEVFDMLAARKDAESEKIALEYTLKRLETDPPIGQMSNLIIRTKDPRAIPLLIRQFRSQKQNRYGMINMLAGIGDDSVAKMLVAEYPKLDNREKRYALQGLQQLHSGEFIRLASEALLINDSSLLNAAAQGLQQEGSPQAEWALIEAMKQDAKHNYWRYVCNALTSFATPEARQALREARDSKNANKKSAAISALRSLQQRSPGSQYIYQARNFAKQQKWDQAIRYYDLALEADPQYADAYAGRGIARLNLKKVKEAKADFDQAVKADPENSQGHTGIAIVKILDGHVKEGVEYAESSRKQFEPYETNKALMLYNLACVYGRAVEKLTAAPADAARDKQLKTYRTKAIAELNAAIKNHFADFDLMKSDPDLKSLAKLPEFQKLLPDAAKAAKKVRPNLGIGQAAGGGGGIF